MKKRICAWALIVCLLAMGLLAMAEAASPVGALLSQITSLMSAREQIYGLRRSALDGLLAFCRRKDYPSLLAARLACDSATRALQAMELPAMTLTDEELSALMLLGVDTDALEMEFASLGGAVDSAAGDMAMYKAMLYSAAYHISQQDTLAGWQAIGEKRLALDARYDRMLMNALLLPLAGRDEVTAFLGESLCQWPEIGGAAHEWAGDEGTLAEGADALMGEYEALGSEASAVLGRYTYGAEQIAAMVDGGDLDAMRQDALTIARMPAALPLPSGWLTPQTSSMYAPGDEGQPDESPGTVIVTGEGVPLQAFVEYVELLTAFGAQIFSSEGSDEAGWQYALIYGDGVLTLRWDAQRVTAAYDPQRLTLETTAYILSRP